MWCDIGSNIFGTASSFRFNRSENPALNAFFVNESTLSEQRTTFLLMQSGASIKNKVNQIKLIVWFLRRPAFAALVVYLLCARVGGAKHAVM